MAKAIVLLSALCILAIANFAVAEPEVFNVEGNVFCDTCRLGFVTPLSDAIEGATVRLQCRDMATYKEKFTTEGKTDATGKYSLRVEGDHENDICEVTLVKSPKENCAEIVSDLVSSRIVCSKNVGMHNAVRFANPLLFHKDKPVQGCRELIEKMELVDLMLLENDEKN
ncbi:anther-specific protein LAT52 [Capsicum chacoense]|uniref:Anther-specific protein LAT52 n=1 Tax=Capsicum annuum TaxID=4072 RepID=A0A1U8HKV0_CAPAN|nr:anther-specific protein LAT52 [Capsicum annuum]KAF3662132.1 Anther-specific protein LAT52 [Capsicum annuum]KAF3679744.1 Anther-specific protein LAT52 [Capsicum annuum]PHT77065.1 Anther-specific protein LAT52 [Capsicum annuum]